MKTQQQFIDKTYRVCQTWDLSEGFMYSIRRVVVLKTVQPKIFFPLILTRDILNSCFALEINRKGTPKTPSRGYLVMN